MCCLLHVLDERGAEVAIKSNDKVLWTTISVRLSIQQLFNKAILWCKLVIFVRFQIAHCVVKSLDVCFLISYSSQVFIVLGFSRVSLER